MIGIGIPIFIDKGTVSVFKGSSLQGECNQVADTIRYVLRRVHPIIIFKRFQIYGNCTFIKEKKTETSCYLCFDGLFEENPDMGATPGTGTFRQSVNTVSLAYEA